MVLPENHANGNQGCRPLSLSARLRGEREGLTPTAWEGEVGSAADPHLTPTLSAPQGGEGDFRQPANAFECISGLPKISLSALGGGEGRGEVGVRGAAHLTLPRRRREPLPLPPQAGGEGQRPTALIPVRVVFGEDHTRRLTRLFLVSLSDAI